jgi:hypothetical protein
MIKESLYNLYMPPYQNNQDPSLALRMLLCTPSSNFSTEKSYSALKRVKTYLRSTKEGHLLNLLAILNIEADLIKNY